MRETPVCSWTPAVLVFNCAVLDPPGSPPVRYARHMPLALVGQLAGQAHVKRLVLTHIAPLVEKPFPRCSNPCRHIPTAL